MVHSQVGETNTAAVIIEPIQGEGGFVVPPAGWLSRVADYCREHGIVLIADEIQTGFCRTGDWFACDHEGVVPDLITTAKGIAGGLPLAAVTGRAELMDSVHSGGSRRHLRRQPGGLRRRARRDRDHAGGGPVRPGAGRSRRSSATGWSSSARSTTSSPRSAGGAPCSPSS